METQPEYRPQGGIGIPQWDRCWARGEHPWDSCERPGNKDRLGLCEEHYLEVCP